MKRISFAAFSAVIVAACSGGPEKAADGLPAYYTDLHYRDSVLLAEGLISYGEGTSAEVFSRKIEAMSEEERAYLAYVYNDYADMADMADYAYKDREVALPDGWSDLAADDAALAGILGRYSVSGLLPSGLKCSLMAKGDRRVLVFAGTDFPASWKDMDQVMNFIVDAYEDVNGALNADASQVILAEKLVNELLSEGYVTKDNLEFAGHSLGGRLASEMSVRYGCPAVLFNAAGVSPEVYDRYESVRKSAGDDWRGYIVDITAANDPLTTAQKYMSESSGLVYLVKGLTDKYSGLVEKYLERDYRALGALMTIEENNGGHGIKELAAALRSRAESCAD